MPDLLTHTATSYLVGYRYLSSPLVALLVFGSALPDLLSRVPEIILHRFLDFPVYHFFSAFHTPFGLLLACYLISFSFKERQRVETFFCLLFGSALHFLMDLMQEQFYLGVYMPYFPFSFKVIQWPFFDINASLYIAPIIGGVAVLIWRKKQLSIRHK